ncbi:MAG: Isopentenyl-diphosphate delta-isomerase, type 1 [uncultured bacterium]|nr:MAG: Isopentenyl-diphosphate delta-isomerase, type 1 [uncultured bacterium]HBR71933.1 isopentenyl-diphosphate delta-isomerase [Candidatus Moranbacteria bacterium]
MEEDINLVDNNGNRVGFIGKMDAHFQGKLHEAFSIFVFNKNNELLLQKRADEKYHSGGLWSNTCCGHPRANENLNSAVHRRLNEEMGFDCELKEVFSFIYNAKLPNALIEYEFDHVFIGHFEKTGITPNPEEASDYKWIKLEDLKKDLETAPQEYTEWFKIILNYKKFINITSDF